MQKKTHPSSSSWFPSPSRPLADDSGLSSPSCFLQFRSNEVGKPRCRACCSAANQLFFAGSPNKGVMPLTWNHEAVEASPNSTGHRSWSAQRAKAEELLETCGETMRNWETKGEDWRWSFRDDEEVKTNRIPTSEPWNLGTYSRCSAGCN